MCFWVHNEFPPSCLLKKTPTDAAGDGPASGIKAGRKKSPAGFAFGGQSYIMRASRR